MEYIERDQVTANPEDSRPIHKHLADLQDATESLRQAITELGKRLEHVTMPLFAEDGNVPKDSPDRPILSPIAEKIHMEAARIRKARALLVDILDRLEV